MPCNVFHAREDVQTSAIAYPSGGRRLVRQPACVSAHVDYGDRGHRLEAGDQLEEEGGGGPIGRGDGHNAAVVAGEDAVRGDAAEVEAVVGVAVAEVVEQRLTTRWAPAERHQAAQDLSGGGGLAWRVAGRSLNGMSEPA